MLTLSLMTWITCRWNVNKIVWSELWTIQNYVLFDQKWLTIFDKVLTPFWKMFLWLKQSFDAKIWIQRLSSFTVPRRVTRLMVALNIADPVQSQRKINRSLKDISQRFAIPSWPGRIFIEFVNYVNNFFLMDRVEQQFCFVCAFDLGDFYKIISHYIRSKFNKKVLK